MTETIRSHIIESSPLALPDMPDLTTAKQYSVTLDTLCDGEIIYTVSNLSDVTLLAVSGYCWADTYNRLEWMMVEYGIFID
jgi:hypothetical protein